MSTHAAPSTPSRSRRGRPAARPPRRLPYWFLRMRRPLAALLAAVAVALAVHALRPPEPPTVTAVVTARDVPAGTSLAPEDVTTREVPAEGLGPGVLDRTDAAVGRGARIALPAGTPITLGALLGPSIASEAPPGTTVFAVELARPADAALAEVGRWVTLVVTDPRTGEGRSVGPALVLGDASRTVAAESVMSPTNPPERVILYVALRGGAAIVRDGALASGPVSVVLTP